MSEVASKWGLGVAGRGFAQVPNYLLLLNQFLEDDHRLTPVELLLLIQLAGGWWKKESLPFPSISTLAKRCGVSDRQIQRALARLEKLRFVERIKRRGKRGFIASNAYDLGPLVEVLQEVAKAFPNEFPRAVTQEQRKTIAQRLVALEPVGATAAVGAPTVVVGEPSGAEPTQSPEQSPATTEGTKKPLRYTPPKRKSPLQNTTKDPHQQE